MRRSHTWQNLINWCLIMVAFNTGLSVKSNLCYRSLVHVLGNYLLTLTIFHICSGGLYRLAQKYEGGFVYGNIYDQMCVDFSFKVESFIWRAGVDNNPETLVCGHPFGASRPYTLSNVILVDEKLTSVHKCLWYSHKHGTIVFSTSSTILLAPFST